MSDTGKGTSPQRRATDDDVRLDQVAPSPRPLPTGQVVAAPLTDSTGTAFGLLWAGEGSAGFVPRAVGSPEVAQATTYAWRVLAHHETDALKNPDLWAPMYTLGQPAGFANLQAATNTLL